MLASIVIPTYNQRPHYLLDAVCSALEQTVAVEVIVVDDGSDPPASGLPDRVRVIRHEGNRGISAALNTGIQSMETEWFCWLSSDDTIVPHKVETQLRSTMSAGLLCSCHRYTVDGELISLIPDLSSHRRQKKQMGAGCVINGSTAMIHRSVFDDVGLFDESYKYGQDWEMWCRITQSYEWHYLSEVLGHRRNGGNLTERIARDEAMRAERDAEDERIRKQYGPK